MSKPEDLPTSILIYAKKKKNYFTTVPQQRLFFISSNVKYRDTFCLTSLANEPWNTFADVDLVIISNMAIKSY